MRARIVVVDEDDILDLGVDGAGEPTATWLFKRGSVEVAEKWTAYLRGNVIQLVPAAERIGDRLDDADELPMPMLGSEAAWRHGVQEGASRFGGRVTSWD